ncbi:hypothetical protein [Aquimarina agarilytica]|uniref:hypothetical protein n=1 Tax=Aquimarina agarilytica TaxID=1087449 RepID=UPI0002897E26|nr:hypothetical protein [Aquimarina agarilytica]
MTEVIPYKNVNEALTHLDNGGRFYNILTKADDGIISEAELGKVGGIFNDKQKMILFFELSISKLDQEKRNSIILKLDNNLQELYSKYKPIEFLASEVETNEIITSNVIITGVPQFTSSHSDFNGFIMTPVISGNVTTFIMTPLIDSYDVYKLRDEKSNRIFLIAHAKQIEKLPPKKIKVAGVLKELKSDKNETPGVKKFLEAIYYMEID